jgi:hypothetical protein
MLCAKITVWHKFVTPTTAQQMMVRGLIERGDSPALVLTD